MNILFLSDEFLPKDGPCTKRIQTLAEYLRDQGHSIRIITSSQNKKGKQKAQLEGIRIRYVPAWPMKRKSAINRLLNNATFAVSAFFGALFFGKTDVIFTTSPPVMSSIAGVLASKLKRAKLVFDVRDIWPDVAVEMDSFGENSLYYKVFSKIANRAYQQAALITTVSPGKVEKIKEKVSALQQNPDKVVYIGNGLDENFLKNQIDPEIVRQYDLENQYTCLYIGNIGLAQGLGKLIDLAENTRDLPVQFLLFGDGAEREKLEAQVVDKQLSNVRFCGTIENRLVYTLLSKANLSFISLKSNKMTDSIPTKIYEALGCGCPVFLIASGDSVDILKESGLGVASDGLDLQKMTEDFRSLYHHVYTKEQKEYASRLMREKYSRQTFAAAFNQALLQIED